MEKRSLMRHEVDWAQVRSEVFSHAEGARKPEDREMRTGCSFHVCGLAVAITAPSGRSGLGRAAMCGYEGPDVGTPGRSRTAGLGDAALSAVS
jgi:hypothetical protein